MVIWERIENGEATETCHVTAVHLRYIELIHLASYEYIRAICDHFDEKPDLEQSDFAKCVPANQYLILVAMRRKTMETSPPVSMEKAAVR